MDNYKILSLNNTRELNQQLKNGFSRAEHDGLAKYSHFFGGRHENIYVAEQDIPEITPLLHQVMDAAVAQTERSKEQLKVGFWFNKMGPGHRTEPHTHDDYDELLSAVYYIDVPHYSGDLILKLDDGDVRIPAKEGSMVVFDPNIEHAVTVNQSHKTRLSIAFNIGPASS